MAFWNRRKATESVRVGPMDPYGLAILQHTKTGREQWFNLHYSGSVQPSMLLSSSMYLTPSEPQLEVIRKTTVLCKGKVLDVGAGGGYSALLLQERSVDVTALDLSPHCVKAMQEIGVNQCVEGDIRTFEEGRYDTLLMLDSVLGCGGSPEGITELLSRLHDLLAASGHILVHEGTQQMGVRVFEFSGHFQYEDYVGNEFQWCNISRDRLSELAATSGWVIEYPYEDDIEGRYIAQLISK